MTEANEYDRVRRAVEAQTDFKSESELRARLVDQGYDPALVARALSDRKWRSTKPKPRLGTLSLAIGYIAYAIFDVAAFFFLLSRPGGANPPTDGMIVGAIVLIAAVVLAFMRQPGVALGLLAGFVAMTVVSSGGMSLLTDRYETIDRTILLYPSVGVVAGLFYTLIRRVP